MSTVATVTVTGLSVEALHLLAHRFGLSALALAAFGWLLALCRWVCHRVYCWFANPGKHVLPKEPRAVQMGDAVAVQDTREAVTV